MENCYDTINYILEKCAETPKKKFSPIELYESAAKGNRYEDEQYDWVIGILTKYELLTTANNPEDWVQANLRTYEVVKVGGIKKWIKQQIPTRNSAPAWMDFATLGKLILELITGR